MLFVFKDLRRAWTCLLAGVAVFGALHAGDDAQAKQDHDHGDDPLLGNMHEVGDIGDTTDDEEITKSI